jgi:hypothetical protein
MLALGMVDEPRHAQLEILHPAKHIQPLLRPAGRSWNLCAPM